MNKNTPTLFPKMEKPKAILTEELRKQGFLYTVKQQSFSQFSVEIPGVEIGVTRLPDHRTMFEVYIKPKSVHSREVALVKEFLSNHNITANIIK